MPVDCLEEDPANPRTEFPDEEIAELAQDIVQRGILQPIVVRRSAEEGRRYVFTSLLSGERPMSENTLRAALRRMGYGNDDMTPHGFRAMARTIMIEQLNVHPDVIEAQLANGKSGPLGAAYDRAEFVAQRRVMLDQWADYLDVLRDAASGIKPTTLPSSALRSSRRKSKTPESLKIAVCRTFSDDLGR